MHAISKEFIQTMLENDFYLTKENLSSYFKDMARIYRDTDELDETIYSENLKNLYNDRDLIVSELKDIFN